MAPELSDDHQERIMAVGLIFIDLQNDYFPSGAMELAGSEPADEIMAEWDGRL
jgi:nicotinamidase-related amidase